MSFLASRNGGGIVSLGIAKCPFLLAFRDSSVHISGVKLCTEAVLYLLHLKQGFSSGLKFRCSLSFNGATFSAVCCIAEGFTLAVWQLKSPRVSLPGSWKAAPLFVHRVHIFLQTAELAICLYIRSYLVCVSLLEMLGCAMNRNHWSVLQCTLGLVSHDGCDRR